MRICSVRRCWSWDDKIFDLVSSVQGNMTILGRSSGWVCGGAIFTSNFVLQELGAMNSTFLIKRYLEFEGDYLKLSTRAGETVFVVILL